MALPFSNPKFFALVFSTINQYFIRAVKRLNDAVYMDNTCAKYSLAKQNHSPKISDGGYVYCNIMFRYVNATINEVGTITQ